MQDRIVNFKDNFEFDQDIANCFSDMLARSIPDYRAMREMIFHTGYKFLKDKSKVIDLGCSNGGSVKRFVDWSSYGPERVDFFLYDNSIPMLEACRERFKNHSVNINLHNADLRYTKIEEGADLILSILTLQFIPIEFRPDVLKRIYNSLTEDGAFILVEKVICSNNKDNKLFIEQYYDIKKNNGYSEEQILNKKASLENVLVPLTEEMNRELIKGAGFSSIECFWRTYNFAGYIIRK